MANKQLNARFQQKHDTEANWNRVGTTFTPLKGEVIVYDVDSTHSVPRFKIGDGTTKLSSLPFYQSGVQKVTSGTANGTISVDSSTVYAPGITDIATGSAAGTIKKTTLSSSGTSSSSDVKVSGWDSLSTTASSAYSTATAANETASEALTQVNNTIIPRLDEIDGQIADLQGGTSGVQSVKAGTVDGTLNVDGTTVKIPGITNIATGGIAGTISKTVYNSNGSSTTSNVQVNGWSDLTSTVNGKLDSNKVVQTTGTSTSNIMSQKAVTDAIKAGSGGGSSVTVVQSTGSSTTSVMSQKATTDAINVINNSINTRLGDFSWNARKKVIQHGTGWIVGFDSSADFVRGPGYIINITSIESYDGSHLSYDPNAGDILILSPADRNSYKTISESNMFCTRYASPDLEFQIDSNIPSDSDLGERLTDVATIGFNIIIIHPGNVFPDLET